MDFFHPESQSVYHVDVLKAVSPSLYAVLMRSIACIVLVRYLPHKSIAMEILEVVHYDSHGRLIISTKMSGGFFRLCLYQVYPRSIRLVVITITCSAAPG